MLLYLISCVVLVWDDTTIYRVLCTHEYVMDMLIRALTMSTVVDETRDPYC